MCNLSKTINYTNLYLFEHKISFQLNNFDILTPTICLHFSTNVFCVKIKRENVLSKIRQTFIYLSVEWILKLLNIEIVKRFIEIQNL